MSSAALEHATTTNQDKVNILMVDDQPAKLLTYQAMLADLGENLITATSSSQALHHLLKNEIAVILMDVNMPDMDGFEIAEIIRQHPRFQDIAILFISALHLTDGDRLKGYRHGAVDYISVPVVPEVLRAKVSIFVDLYRKTRQLESLNRSLEGRVAERTEKLQESEGQFRTLANSIPQLAWMASHDGSTFWYNQRWREYTGASLREMEEGGWLKYIHPQHAGRVAAMIKRSRETREEWHDTHPILGREGGYRWFLSRAVPIRDSHEQVVRWFGTATDITDRIQAEERIKNLNRALKQQITDLETVMQVLPVGVGLARDADCNVIEGNAALYAMLGEDSGANLSMSGSSDLAFEVFQNDTPVPPDQLPMQKAARTREPVGSSELELRFHNGRVVHMVVNASPLFDDSENVRGAVAAHFDISQRKAMEKLVRELADLIDLASEAIMIRDQQGLVQYWNSGAEALYGWRRDEVLNRQMHHVLETRFPVPYPLIQEELARAGKWEGNLIQRTKDGREITVACRKAIKAEGARSAAAVLEINRDITDELRVQDVLRRTDKLAAMGRIAGMIAHEINNPLEAVVNAMFLVGSHPSLDPEARRYMQIADEELARVCHITRQTLSFYRESLQPVPVVIAEVIEEILDLHVKHLQKTGIVARMKRRSNQSILGFPGELKQVFLNLVDNAVQAMQEGGKLRVHIHNSTEARSGRRGIRISITDTGAGIDYVHSERIFEPFFTTKAMKGTGLGLWITKGIVHKYEGTIRFRTLHSSTGCLTCFSIFFPGSQAAQDDESAETAACDAVREPQQEPQGWQHQSHADGP